MKTREEIKLEAQIEVLERKLQIAAQLNHDMWKLLEEQTNRTEQLERLMLNEKESGTLYKVLA